MITKLNYLLLILLFVSWGCSKKQPIYELQVAGVEYPEILLNGTWKFTMNPPEKFWENSVDTKSWNDISVPGECQMQGFAIKHDQPFVYKKEISVPDDFENKSVLLNFYGVYSYAKVWVNGEFVRDHWGGFTKWSCDLTDKVKAGEKAIITVEVTDRADDISYGSGYAKHQIGGILRDVELVALPACHFKQLYVETELDDDYRDANLKIYYEVSNANSLKAAFELLDSNDELVTAWERNLEVSRGEINLPVENPKKWDAEHPNLYTLVTRLFVANDEVLSQSQRIGFREVKVDGNKLLVNGNPVKLRGACRHDVHPTLGRTTTADYDLKDVLLAKECNMNFIRTSHYPPSETFLKYCDEFGIYVEDETAVCFVGSHRTEAYRASGASQADPEFSSRYLSQLEEMVDNHRNHPSIIIWSIGNENTFGHNFIKSYEWMKNNDLTRPIIYSYPGQVPDSLINYEILSMHYPDWRGNLNQYGIQTKDFNYEPMPVLFDEWAHVACYNNFELKEDPNVRSFWGQSLDSMWTKVFEAPGGLGGAIWCMLDETFMLPEDLDGFNEWWGILDKNVIPATYMGPTVGYGEWGIVDAWRRKKPEFWGTKKAYSPTKIYQKQIDDFKTNKVLTVPVHNRFDHTDFSELKIQWKYNGNTGLLNGVSLAPHTKGELVFPAQDWASGQKLNIQFYQNDTCLVDEYNLQLGERKTEQLACSEGILKVVKNNEVLRISGKQYAVTINKQSGLLENLTVNDQEVVKSGPYLNLKLPGKAIQYSTIQMDQYGKDWKMKDLHVDIKDGIAEIKTQGNYGEISVDYIIKLDENGVCSIDYHVDRIPANKNIQELGLRFIMGDNFEKIAWDRNAYFTAYPDGDLGCPKGIAHLSEMPKMNYWEKPGHRWELDSQGYYYFGLKKQLPYSNIVRALKEHIYSYSISSSNAELEVVSNGQQACRFDKVSNENVLIINDKWDYNSLLWGNYYKRINVGSTYNGKVGIKFTK
ncbi:beta-galactosidase [Puteibacter caeruleilacunae]|nr:beta-galactosidase [Puteibacter caeruleilacunae]